MNWKHAFWLTASLAFIMCSFAAAIGMLLLTVGEFAAGSWPFGLLGLGAFFTLLPVLLKIGAWVLDRSFSSAGFTH